MDRRLPAAAIVLAAASAAPASNLILNGSFEQNTASIYALNLSNDQFNAAVAFVTAFGGASEIDMSPAHAGGPHDGSYAVSLHTKSFNTDLRDAFSFDLSAPMVAGREYTVEFWASRVDFFPGTLEIGISDSATDFGTLVYTTPSITVSQYSLFSHTFTATMDAAYLTVRSGSDPDSFVVVDAFSLTAVPVPLPGAALAGGSLAGLLALRRARPCAPRG